MSDKEDFLDVDQQIAGQNYALLSFISPENTIQKKELFMVHNFLQLIYNKNKESLNKSDNETTERGYYSGDGSSYRLPDTFKEFTESFEDFKFKHDEELTNQFNKENNFSTNMRGVKVRGVYDILSHAQKKAKELQSKDPNFNVFVGQVGYWLPWDPTTHHIEDEVYANQELNNLMQKYKENKVNRDLFYQELTQERIEYAKKEGEKKRDDDGKLIENDNEVDEPKSDSNFKEMVKNIF